MNPDDLTNLAAFHASRTGHALPAWTNALAPLPDLLAAGHLTWNDTQRLLDAIPDPAHVETLLLDWTGEDDHAEGIPFDRLADAVDDSSYSLADWLLTYATLSAHLTTREHTASFTRKLGYLVCTAELANRNPLRLPLPEVLEEMLAEFGFAAE